MKKITALFSLFLLAITFIACGGAADKAAPADASDAATADVIDDEAGMGEEDADSGDDAMSTGDEDEMPADDDMGGDEDYDEDEGDLSKAEIAEDIF